MGPVDRVLLEAGFGLGKSLLGELTAVTTIDVEEMGKQ